MGRSRERSKKAVICVSGPSLCTDDTLSFRKRGIEIITVNSSWIMDPSCDFIFSANYAWWGKYFNVVNSPAQKWTCSQHAAQRYSINHFGFSTDNTYNSGLMAIYFAISRRVEEIYLQGYDCSLSDGVHWHGKHTGISNPTSYQVKRWISEFEHLAGTIDNNVKIINCSRKTSLNCFNVRPLEKVLCDEKWLNPFR